MLTNLQVGGQLACDQTFVIVTWYARTNVTDVCRFQAGAVIIPVRQNFGVRLYSDSSALTALLKLMPENIAPRPLVWVHLDGVLTRDIA